MRQWIFIFGLVCFCWIANAFQPRQLLVDKKSTGALVSTFLTSLKNNVHQSSDDHHDTTVSLAEEAFSLLANRKRTWRRMRHLVDLALNDQHGPPRTVADIGCDHGILSIALASTGKFEKVIGVDVSENALGGAKALHRDVQQHLEGLTNNGAESSSKKPAMSPLEFRVGNGFAAIQEDEAVDVVCIAGMGVNTMLKILTPSQTARVGCRLLLLQPTNTKPGNLVYLYDCLNSAGWKCVDERIDFMKSRWYWSVAFCKVEEENKGESQQPTTELLPGMRLGEVDDLSMKETLDAYVSHHIAWLGKEEQLPSGLHEPEIRWLEFYRKQ